MEQMIIGIGLIAVCILAVKAPKLLSSSAPTQTARARVISRQGEMTDSSYSSFHGTKMRFQVTFSLDSGNVTLYTDATRYTRLLEGVQGQLTWQGNTLISFDPEEAE